MTDLFVVFAAADAPFVRGYLLPALGLAQVLLVDELPPGGELLAAIERGVAQSRATVTVLSPAFVADPLARAGEWLASHAALDDALVIPLLLGDVDAALHVRARVSLDFRDASAWAAQTARLRQALGAAAAGSDDDALPCPYPGMRPFAEADAPRFFGRTAELGDVLGRLRRGERELFVIGPSGSGKSSLVYAAVIPKLRAGAATKFMRPGASPCARLRDALEHRTGKLVLFVDQLEELFAIAPPDERAAFLSEIRTLRADPDVVLIYALRADFYGALMESPLWSDVGEATQISRVEVGPLRGRALADAIEQPARAVGVYLEAGLVERLLVDAAAEPGALPLLQETLVLLWEHRRRRLLALADYAALGDDQRTGLAVALARRADTTLRSLTAPQQATARRVLVRLVQFGEGRADTRRQQPLAALRTAGESDAALDAVLARLTEDRLLTLSGDGDARRTVDLSHEALLSAWPALRDWIAARRVDEERRRGFEDSVALWEKHARSPDRLLPAAELTEADAWLASPGAAAVGSSAALRDLVAASRAALARAAHRRRTRLRITAATALFVIAALGALLLWANTQRRAADRATVAERAARDDAARTNAIADTGLAQVLLDTDDREIGTAIAHLTRALRSDPTYRPAAMSLLALMMYEPWKLRIATLSVGANAVMAISPDGAVIAAGGDLATVVLCDPQTGARLRELTAAGPVYALAFSHDGAFVAAGLERSRVQVWDVRTGAPQALLAPPAKDDTWTTIAVGFSRDDAAVVEVDYRSARAWDWRRGTSIASRLLTEGTSTLVEATFDPRGELVAPAGNHTAAVLSIPYLMPFEPPFKSRPKYVTFAPDGRRATLDNQIWDRETFAVVPVEGSARSLVLSPNGYDVVGIDRAGTVTLDRKTFAMTSGPARPDAQGPAAVFAPDGRRVLVRSPDLQTAKLFDVETGAAVSQPFAQHADITAMVVLPTNDVVALASVDGTVTLWDARAGRPAGVSDTEVAAPHQASPPPPPCTLPGPAAPFAHGNTGQYQLRDVGQVLEVWSAACELVLRMPQVINERQAWFSARDRALVARSTDDVSVWSLETRRRVGAPLPVQAVSRAFVSDDAAQVLTVGAGGAALWHRDGDAWSIARHFATRSPLGVSAVVDREWRLLVIGDTAGVALYDLESGTRYFRGLRAGVGTTAELSLSDDGASLRIRSNDRIEEWPMPPAGWVASRDVLAFAELLGRERISDAGIVETVPDRPSGALDRVSAWLAARDGRALNALTPLRLRDIADRPAYARSKHALDYALSIDPLDLRLLASLAEGYAVGGQEFLMQDPDETLTVEREAGSTMISSGSIVIMNPKDKPRFYPVDKAMREAALAKFYCGYVMAHAPIDARTLASIANAYDGLGERAKGRKIAAKALAIDPANATALEVLARK